MGKFKRLSLSVIMLFLIAGCGGGGGARKPDPPDDFRAVLKGTVTDSRGGSAVSGANVTAPFATTTTDAQGRFELVFSNGNPVDILIQKAGQASTRVQGISLQKDQTLELEIPCRAQVSDEAVSPPQITLTGVASGQTVSGTLDLNIQITGQKDISYVYIYFGGEQREPATGSTMDQDNLNITVDTARYPNGPSYIKILAYDQNDNAVLYLLPVTVQNGVEPPATVPALAVLNVESRSYGTSIGAYSKKIVELSSKANFVKPLGGAMMEVKSAPAGAGIYHLISWDTVPGVEGYNVYRSFDGVSYQKIGSILEIDEVSPNYEDYSAQLAVNKKTYYKVAPYIDTVEGEAIVREVTPLPTYKVSLQSPADGGTGVSLTPTFVWQNQFSHAMPTGAQFSCVVILNGPENFSEQSDPLGNVTQTVWSDALNLGSDYSWNVISFASITYEEKANGSSTAYSFADGGSGASNGDFVFTTTTAAP